MKPRAFVGALLGLSSTTAGAYVWPSSYDEIEDILSLQSGYLSRGFADGVTPCSFGGNVKGRQNAAEWIRTAFHDMITHDSKAGTGGLDGSIWFETTRPENNARAFNNTFSFFSNLYSTKASAADLLAMSVIVSHSACGGTTKIPFRYGRVDADEGGPYGVPEAHSPLDTTLDRFKAAGYNREEMILLVACGHTLGGVHSVDFPEISEGDTDPYNDTVTHFDSSPNQFDNNIAAEYVKGTTTNPLVIGKNDTLNSDKRIFSSDRNRTMKAMARKPSAFEAKCANVFSRMIDTVPKDVKLSSSIEATDIKPYITELYLNGNGSLTFTGRVRVRTTEGGKTRNSEDLTAHLTYSDRQEKGNTKVETTQAGDSAGLYGETFTWFEFETTVNATKGISKFNIYLTVPSTGKTTKYTNGGHGYPIDDTLLYQKSESCVSRTTVNGMRALNVTAAVRKDRVSAPLQLEIVRLERRQGTLVRILEKETIAFESTGEEQNGYLLMKAPAQLATSAWSTTFDIVQQGANGSKIEFIRTEACPRVTNRRLEDVTRLLQDLKSSMPTSNAHLAPATSTMTSKPDTEILKLVGDAPDSTANGLVVEGGPSLTAHSGFAKDFIRKAVGDSPLGFSNKKAKDVLDVLKGISGSLDHQMSKIETTYPSARPTCRPSYRDSKLPPIQKVMAAMHENKRSPFNATTWIRDLFPIERFSDICVRVYFSENFSESDFIIVNSGLLQLFMEKSQHEPEGKGESSDYALMCRANLETALFNLPLHLPATQGMIVALLFGVVHAIEISKPSLAWTLSSKASELCQSLGYHHLGSTQHSAVSGDMDHEQFLFWAMYFFDKNLSLRLGRPSTIQDWDITTPILPFHGSCLLDSIVSIWIRTAQCQGNIYEKLYSPDALSQPDHIRQSRVEALSNELHDIDRQSREMSDDHIQEANNKFGSRVVESLILSDDVLRLSLLTLVHRAGPPPKDTLLAFTSPCIQAARATLQRHHDFLTVFEDMTSLYFMGYVHWILLLAPFTPFIVLFCHAIECQDETDLSHLQAFISSIKSAPAASEAAAKMHRLFQVLYNVALRYLEFQSSASKAGQAQSKDTLNTYLTTLGLPILNQNVHQHDNLDLQPDATLGAESQQALHGGVDTFMGVDEIDPTVWMGNMAGLEEWFDGNHQLINLLDDVDFSFD
ncbi:hypothetical protein NM208_g994 [Fusarium decemcellulare]|uniref:Uncharacterized protein n=1 Tax=Fusarium decemcellulare TaxID=57161 RepID=A0ACC1SXL1_9HYPO|nr:hypothetical protein NM208_g994 [Fusarium decemcellulare]